MTLASLKVGDVLSQEVVDARLDVLNESLNL